MVMSADKVSKTKNQPSKFKDKVKVKPNKDGREHKEGDGR